MSEDPDYVSLWRSGQLDRRSQQLDAVLDDCTLCPRQCHVNRLRGERGFCKAGADLMISSFGPHFGEEPPLTGGHVLWQRAAGHAGAGGPDHSTCKPEAGTTSTW